MWLGARQSAFKDHTSWDFTEWNSCCGINSFIRNGIRLDGHWIFFYTCNQLIISSDTCKWLFFGVTTNRSIMHWKIEIKLEIGDKLLSESS